MSRKRVPGVGSGNRESSAADGSQSDWRHDQTVSSGTAQSSSTRDINSRGERPQIPWCVAMEDSECCGTVASPVSHVEVQGRGATGRWPITGERQRARRGLMKRHACKVEISIMIMMMELNELRLAWLL